MTLAFLYPLALLGAAAVAVPVWLHLHRRFHGQVVRFSALRFLHDEPPARRAPLRVEHPLLLALRALAVVLLATAFAWPFDRSRVVAPSIESYVYVFDNTLSRQAGDRGGPVAGADVRARLVCRSAAPGRHAAAQFNQRPSHLAHLQ